MKVIIKDLTLKQLITGKKLKDNLKSCKDINCNNCPYDNYGCINLENKKVKINYIKKTVTLEDKIYK